MEKITGNPVHAHLAKFIRSEPQGLEELTALVDLVHSVQELQNESDSSLLRGMAKHLHATYISKSASSTIIALPEKLRARSMSNLRRAPEPDNPSACVMLTTMRWRTAEHFKRALLYLYFV